MALDKGVAFKLRKGLAVFVGLAFPHAKHGLTVDVPEAIDNHGQIREVLVQRRPMSRDRGLHE